MNKETNDFKCPPLMVNKGFDFFAKHTKHML